MPDVSLNEWRSQDQSVSCCLPALVLIDRMWNLEPESENPMNPVRGREECSVTSLRKREMEERFLVCAVLPWVETKPPVSGTD